MTRLLTEGAGAAARITGVEVIDEHGVHRTLRADAYVMAMGSFSVPLLQPLGIDLLIYPGKGYSATYAVTNPDLAPSVSLTDDGYKLVVSRLGDRLRVAGTCELNGYTRELNTHALRSHHPPHAANCSPAPATTTTAPTGPACAR